MKYYNVKVLPDIVNGDISDVIDADKTDKAFAAGDLIFDWKEFYVPKGAAKLEGISLYMNGADGAVPVAGDIHLVFARDVDGVAPLSAGTPNGAGMVDCFNLATNFLGGIVLEGNTAGVGKIKGPSHGSIYTMTRQSTNGAQVFCLSVDGEESSSRPGYTKLYVAGVADGSFNYSTGVLLNDGSDVADDAGTSLTTDGTDARKVFQKGDTVYVHDVDTAIGVVESTTATTIVLQANNVGAIADDDELINANPIKIHLGFSK